MRGKRGIMLQQKLTNIDKTGISYIMDLVILQMMKPQMLGRDMQKMFLELTV
jgi:hypothetical protein